MKNLSKHFVTSAAAIVMMLGATLLASNVMAHDDDTLDKMKTPNGGQARMAGMYHFELLMNKDSKGNKEEKFTVFVTDHAWTKFSTKGATGTATILSGKNKSTVALTVGEDNQLIGMAKYVAKPDLKVVLAISMNGKPAEQAKFTPFKVVKAEEHKHDDGAHHH